MNILRIDIEGHKPQKLSIDTAQCRVSFGDPIEAIASLILDNVYEKKPQAIAKTLLKHGVNKPHISAPAGAFSREKRDCAPTHTLVGRHKITRFHSANPDSHLQAPLEFSWQGEEPRPKSTMVPFGLFGHSVHILDTKFKKSQTFDNLSLTEKKFASFLSGILLNHTFDNLDFFSAHGPSHLLKILPGPFILHERQNIFQSLFSSGLLRENAWMKPTKVLKGPTFDKSVFDRKTFARGQKAQRYLPSHYNGRFDGSAHEKLLEKQLRILLKHSL